LQIESFAPLAESLATIVTDKARELAVEVKKRRRQIPEALYIINGSFCWFA
jgi:hypothetical protein